MDQEDTYRAALVRAAQAVGSPRALSDRLHVPMTALTRWLAGDGHPSMGTFLKVIDIVIEESDKPRYGPALNDSEKFIKFVK
jgi:hypothetical protein